MDAEGTAGADFMTGARHGLMSQQKEDRSKVTDDYAAVIFLERDFCLLDCPGNFPTFSLHLN